MYKKSLKIISAAAVLLLAASSVQAANMRFLDATPITYLKKKDHADLHKAAAAVLDDKKDGESANWTNEGLGNSVRINAEISVANTTNDNATTCRSLTVVLHAKGQDQTLTLPLCKKAAGAWAIEKK
ncbi:Surface antigen [Collimonas arenae]|uniref:Surface antigen n=1 Tax=Collimonas arenae TaxID=279058 RepID=A0A0A1F420_9BURK|nr:hypothetical protein [Collimonas arenae]AIY39473.1 Surface antigen [Collimonas arenae]